MIRDSIFTVICLVFFILVIFVTITVYDKRIDLPDVPAIAEFDKELTWFEPEEYYLRDWK